MSHSGAIYLKYTYVFLPHLIFVIEINRRLNINSSIDGDDTLLEEFIRITGEDELFLHSCDQIHVYLKDKDFSWLPFSLIELLHQVREGFKKKTGKKLTALGGEGGSPPLSLTTSICENYDPFLSFMKWHKNKNTNINHKMGHQINKW